MFRNRKFYAPKIFFPQNASKPIYIWLYAFPSLLQPQQTTSGLVQPKNFV